MKHCFSKMLILAIIAAWQLSAGTVVSDTSGTVSSGTAFYWGETFVTPAGGPWNGLSFNFYSNVPATTPAAAGILYLLSAPYAGAPSGLNNGVSGYIASSTAASGLWTFAPGLPVNGGTQYYVFMDGTSSGLIISGGDLSNLGYYLAPDAATAYQLFSAQQGTTDVNFNLSGTPVGTGGVPEPTTLLLMAPALLLVLRRRLSR